MMGETPEECRKQATARSLSKEYVAATIPFEVFKVQGTTNIHDVSIPEEIKTFLGPELSKLYSRSD